MPYSRTSELPSAVRRVLPVAAQVVFMRAYNGASGDETSRMKIAWGAVRRAGFRRQSTGMWSKAEPRTLYVRRDLVNGRDLVRWARAQGIPSSAILDPDDMHVTIAYSRTPMDWMAVGQQWTPDVTVSEGGPRALAWFGKEKDVLVLQFRSADLEHRHADIVDAGASWDWPDYHPHVTIAYNVPDPKPDIDRMTPYTGKLNFGKEIFEPVDEDWKTRTSKARDPRKTPAKPGERIHGSTRNRQGSASRGGGSVDPGSTGPSISNILSEARRRGQKVPSAQTAAKIVRRGMGAYSTSHRPGASRQGWGYARLRAFIRLLNSRTNSNPGLARADGDLLPAGHPAKPKSVSKARWIGFWSNRNTGTVVSAPNEAAARRALQRKKKDGYGSLKNVRQLNASENRTAARGGWVRTRSDGSPPKATGNTPSRYRPQLGSRR